MSLDEVSEKLKCRYCGRPRIVTRVSMPKKTQVKVFMTCTKHPSEVVYRMPLDLYEKASGLMRDHIFLCRKCGEPVDLVGQKKEGRITTFQIQCPVHKLGDRKINNRLVDLTMSAASGVPSAALVATAPGTSAKFCPSCGTPVAAPEAQFCHHCGASLN